MTDRQRREGIPHPRIRRGRAGLRRTSTAGTGRGALIGSALSLLARRDAACTGADSARAEPPAAAFRPGVARGLATRLATGSAFLAPDAWRRFFHASKKSSTLPSCWEVSALAGA